MGKAQLAAIHPIVPQTRILGKSLSGSFICEKVIEFESAKVGM